MGFVDSSKIGASPKAGYSFSSWNCENLAFLIMSSLSFALVIFPIRAAVAFNGRIGNKTELF